MKELIQLGLQDYEEPQRRIVPIFNKNFIFIYQDTQNQEFHTHIHSMCTRLANKQENATNTSSHQHDAPIFHV